MEQEFKHHPYNPHEDNEDSYYNRKRSYTKKEKGLSSLKNTNIRTDEKIEKGLSSLSFKNTNIRTDKEIFNHIYGSIRKKDFENK